MMPVRNGVRIRQYVATAGTRESRREQTFGCSGDRFDDLQDPFDVGLVVVVVQTEAQQTLANGKADAAFDKRPSHAVEAWIVGRFGIAGAERTNGDDVATPGSVGRHRDRQSKRRQPRRQKARQLDDAFFDPRRSNGQKLGQGGMGRRHPGPIVVAALKALRVGRQLIVVALDRKSVV